MLGIFKESWIKFGLRLCLALGFLSAVADRFGFWPKTVSVWGNWKEFLSYTAILNPWFPKYLIPSIGFIATVLEIGLAIGLILNYKIRITAGLSGVLLLIFGVAMVFTTGIKSVLDYNVFTLVFASWILVTSNKMTH